MRDHIDARLTAAMQDVPVPDGLGQRLLERLAASDNRVLARRRWLLIGGGLLAAAAGLVLALWLAAPGRQRFSEQLVLDEAIRGFAAAAQPRGQLLSETAPPEAYPVSGMVLCPGGTRWRPVDDFLGRGGVIYELPGPAGVHAALYVVEQEGDGLALTPAVAPFTTAGYCAAAWQEGELLYVLVVRGNTAAYQGYLNLPRSPVA